MGMEAGLSPSNDRGEGLYKGAVTALACSGKGFLRTLEAARGGEELSEEEIEAAGDAARGGEGAIESLSDIKK